MRLIPISLLLCSPLLAAELPSDPAQRVAYKAIVLRAYHLKPWQRDGYQHMLDNNITVQGVAKTTSYSYHWESRRMAGGEWTASGSHVHSAGCAANPGIPFGALIWTSYGLRYVTDRGDWVKLGYVRGVGRVTNGREIANLDYYTLKPLPTLRNAPYAIVKASGDRSVWMMGRQEWRRLLKAAGGDKKKAEVR